MMRHFRVGDVYFEVEIIGTRKGGEMEVYGPFAKYASALRRAERLAAEGKGVCLRGFEVLAVNPVAAVRRDEVGAGVEVSVYRTYLGCWS